MIQNSIDAEALQARIAALEIQAQRYRTAFDSISQGVCFFDRDQRLIVGNRTYAEIYRIPADLLSPGTTLRALVEARVAAGACSMAVDDYLSYLSALNAKREEREWTMKLADGRTIRACYRPMPEGGWLGVHEDVSSQNERRLLIEERVSLQSLIDMVPDNLWVKDLDSRFVIANRATALRIGRATPQELIGKSDLELCPWETAQKYLADERTVIESGMPMIDGEEYILDADGGKVWIATTKVPLRDEHGGITGIIGVSRDITRRRLAEALREGQAEILEMIVGGAPVESVLEELVHLMESQTNGGVVSILPLDGAGPRPAAASPAELEAHRGELLSGPLGEAIRRGDLVVALGIAGDPAWARLREFVSERSLRACWSTPFVSRNGAPLGVVAIFARAEREPKEAEIKLAQVAAQLAAIAVERAGG